MNSLPSPVVVFGLGASGEAAARLLWERGLEVQVCDSGRGAGLEERAAKLEAQGIPVTLGATACPREVHLAVLSPGIDLAAPLPASAAARGCPIIGEIELAFQFCRCPVVAITGTNGKTTTTALTAHLLRSAGVRCREAGNIGLPFSQLLREEAELEVVVLEVSSFQLETIQKFHPRTAALLNFSPNHLDRYRSVDEYRTAKLRIFENQAAEDYAVVQAGLSLPPLAAHRITFSASQASADWTLSEGWVCRGGQRVVEMSTTLLRGPHNAENLMAALAIGESLGTDLQKLAQAAGNFQPPPHRCELIRELNGVRWINDSKATTLEAVEVALRGQPGPVILIAGGKDKGFGFSGLLPAVREHVRLAVLIGEMRARIAAEWPGVETVEAASLDEAVAIAFCSARPGDTVLFSPGTSSFDMFRDYIERGEKFREAVAALPFPNHKNFLIHQP